MYHPFPSHMLLAKQTAIPPHPYISPPQTPIKSVAPPSSSAVVCVRDYLRRNCFLEEVGAICWRRRRKLCVRKRFPLSHQNEPGQGLPGNPELWHQAQALHISGKKEIYVFSFFVGFLCHKPGTWRTRRRGSRPEVSVAGWRRTWKVWIQENLFARFVWEIDLLAKVRVNALQGRDVGLVQGRHVLVRDLEKQKIFFQFRSRILWENDACQVWERTVNNYSSCSMRQIEAGSQKLKA